MPRIRTIKPDFWSDEKIVELTPMARLFFIGLWNFSDDSGNVELSTRQLKMRVFPGDNCNIMALIEELTAQGLVVIYEVEDKKYLHIPGFSKHQIINRPSNTKIPPPPKRKTLTEHSLTEGKGSGMEVEGKGKEKKGMEVRGSAQNGGNGSGAIPPSAPLSVDPEVIKLGEAIKRRREGEKLQ
jgi:hypothetical protein